jgi:antitoxin VapB
MVLLRLPKSRTFTALARFPGRRGRQHVLRCAVAVPNVACGSDASPRISLLCAKSLPCGLVAGKSLMLMAIVVENSFRSLNGRSAVVKQKQSGALVWKWHILMYMPGARRANMQRKAKVFMNNRSQAVRLPKEFRFRTQEVFIRKEGSEVVLSPRPFDWTSYLAEGPVASADFMEGIEDLPVQEREP